ncbi:hypothetical protein CYCD_15100 [Tenuifilaceae bacterium CYCD]|nr:hypothetical protein CYCD_15100 [Tenuifilaceae bacterium CYCD]
MTTAIIDLGTNTFNLLVAQNKDNGKYKIIHECKHPVKLGEGGLTQKIITPAAWQRGLDAIQKHMETAKSFSAERFFAFATSATRDASNGKDFVEEILKRFGLKVEIIDGNREATLIYKGVRQAINLGDECNLIIDIGGGSNEIILANSKEIFWLQSFNLGVSRLMQLFSPSDPIKPEEIIAIENHIANEITPLLEAVKKYKPTRMVGSSGSFDSFRNILEFAGKIEISNSTWAQIPMQYYTDLHKTFITSIRDERLAIKGLDPIRVDLIVLASIFVNYLAEQFQIKSMFQSEFALKEGFLSELEQIQ